MENLKVKVNNESESKEVQDLLFELGGDFCFGGKLHCNTNLGLVTINKNGLMANIELDGFDYKEITLQQLKHLVVLKRNSIADATHYYGCSIYYLTDSEFYQYSENKWVNIDEYVDGMTFNKIEKGCEVKNKEYLVKNVYGEYNLTDHHSGFSVEDLIEVPEGAEEYRTNCKFYKNGGKFYYSSYNEWVESGLVEYMTLWKRGVAEHKNKTQDNLGSNKVEVMKEFLNPEQEYALVKCFVGETLIPESWVEVPEGAEIFLLDKSFGEDVFYFVKHDGEVFHEYYISGTNISHNTWIKGTLKELHNGMGNVLWQRNTTTTLDSVNTSTQDKLKFIEKWLNGEKIQYILGIETDESKWHNFTEGAMRYIKRPDIKFRESPKYVTINGIEFKNVEKLMKYVENNFDLEDGE